jgi:hypothetical protein
VQIHLIKYLVSFFIIFNIVSCSDVTNFEDIRSSSLIKPNFLAKQARYDCTFEKDKSLNRLEAFIPGLVAKAKILSSEISLEFLFNQKNNINIFSILYSDNKNDFNSTKITDLLNKEGIESIAICELKEDELFSMDIFIEDLSQQLNSFEVEILYCEFNEGFNYGTFSIEVDSFLNLVRKKDVSYFAKFQQANMSSNKFIWMNYLGSELDKEILYKGWVEEEDSILIQEAFNSQSTCKSASSYKGYKVL